MVRSTMIRLDRRTLLAAAAWSVLPIRHLRAAEPARLVLELRPSTVDLVATATACARFEPSTPPSLRQGAQAEVTLTNRLTQAVMLGWRGMRGSPLLTPWLAQPELPPGATRTMTLQLRDAGIAVLEAGLAGGLPLPALPIQVEEATAPAAERRAWLMIEEWRLRPDGSAIAAGEDSAGAQQAFTINAQKQFVLDAAPGERLRLGIVNASPRAVVALKLGAMPVQVAAIDGQPCQPFAARDSRLVLAPGTRIDAFVDVGSTPGRQPVTLSDGTTEFGIGPVLIAGAPKHSDPLAAVMPLPSNGLPERLALQSAQRFELDLASPQWIAAAALRPDGPTAFRAKRNGVVVLTLRNGSDEIATVNLGGHSARLLDRLDDGWKPFWLDTIVVPPRQTVRIAFQAENPGSYLLEKRGTAWASPHLVMPYAVV
jgi:FtsP/CotA-like multicopper oxidase with cupredoxin domain